MRMPEDREVLRYVWEGKLPVCFTLASEEVHSLNPPEPYFLMVPRVQYLPLVTDKVRRHFSQYVNPALAQNELWVEYDGSPLKWQYPFGLHFDLLKPELPFNLTVHFDNFPEGKLIPCPNKEAVRSHFMSVVKEADALKHKGSIVNSMQEKEHFTLWAGLQNDKFDQFWMSNKQLMSLDFRNIPLRVHTPKRFNLQRLIAPHTDSKPTTLGQALLQFFPSLDNLEIILHGITPPLDTPLIWISVHLSYPDNFIHLVVTQK